MTECPLILSCEVIFLNSSFKRGRGPSLEEVVKVKHTHSGITVYGRHKIKLIESSQI
jgi:hypothetical protein